MKSKTYEELEQAITDYFTDTSRSPADTKDDLNNLVVHIETMIETL